MNEKIRLYNCSPDLPSKAGQRFFALLAGLKNGGKSAKKQGAEWRYIRINKKGASYGSLFCPLIPVSILLWANKLAGAAKESVR